MKRDNSLLRRLKYTPTAVVASVSLLAGCGSPPTNNHELAREYQTPAQTQYVSSVLSPQTSPTPQPRPNTTQICGIPYYQLSNIIPEELYTIDIIKDIDIRDSNEYLTINNPRFNDRLTQLIAQNTPQGIYVGYVRGFPTTQAGLISSIFIPNEDFSIISNLIYTRDFNPNRNQSGEFIERMRTRPFSAPMTNISRVAQYDYFCQVINDLKLHLSITNDEDISTRPVTISLEMYFESTDT